MTAPRLRALPRPEPLADQATVVHVVGARPNFVKMAPLIEALRRRGAARQVVVHTGQHYDRRMSEEILEDLGFPAPDHSMGIGSGSHGEQTGKVLIAFERILLEERPGLVVVAGDVNSTLAAALAASKLHIGVAHIESGLRSRDWGMPEEVNRVLTDRVSDVLLCTSADAVENLASEGITGEGVQLVGNTMIDSLFRLLEDVNRPAVLGRNAVKSREFVLVTLHRPALVDDPERLAAVLTVLARLADKLPVVFPMHPRTRARLNDVAPAALERLVVIDPLEYLDFIAVQASARLVVTDSGGVQEETSALGVPCLTYRDNTERPITVQQGTNRLIGVDPAALERAGAEELSRSLTQARPIPLWDGRAGERAAGAIMELLDRRDGLHERSRAA